MIRILASLALLCVTASACAAPRNIVFILTDDHRFDAMGFAGHPFLETPHMDSLAKNGVYLPNAFVTTALCSPSRASILTGLYAHKHGVVDNNNPVRGDLVFFPQLLQKSGYKTGFFGKWHMGGEGDDPQRGFDKWVSFRGQGMYWASNKGGTRRVMGAHATGLNVDGQRVPQKGYITDELTDYALDWLKTVPKEQPFFFYLSHKAVHSEFVPADRHKGRYKDKALPMPASRTQHEHAPMWVQNQRNSWHGIDFPYHSSLDVADYYRSYCETLLAVDESVGRVLAALRERGQLEDTLVVYMGDNGFAFGEHGLIDKRTAYEWSMRVPLILQCPAALKPGTVVKQVVANIDIAPTLLEAAEVKGGAPAFDGRSFWPLARGEEIPWRTELLYEYFWERNYPHTPTLHALRGERYKYVHAHGIWDLDELYDLQTDPGETKNLIFSAEHAPVVKAMNAKLFSTLAETGGLFIPLQPDRGHSNNLRRKGGSAPATFPPEWIAEPGFRSLFNGKDLTGWCFRAKPKKEDPKPGEILERFDGKTASSDGRYTAGDGVLAVSFPEEADKLTGQIYTVEEFPKNFVLKLEFRAGVNADSGIFIRKPQLQCRDYLVAGPYNQLKSYKPQDWNLIEVTVKDGVAHATCNGEVLEAALALPETGPIGLEGDRGLMEYRRIHLKELPAGTN